MHIFLQRVRCLYISGTIRKKGFLLENRTMTEILYRVEEDKFQHI